MAEVGKVKISNLPLASSVSDNDAMLIVQNGSAKRVLPSLMKGKPGDKGKTGQGFAYKWDGTSLVLGTIAVGSSTIKWGEGVNLKGEQGDEGLKGAGSYVEQSGTKVRFGQSAVGQTSVTWGEYVQLRGSDAIYQWDGTSLKMGTRTYTVDGSTDEYTAGVDLKGATGQGMAYRWVGTKLQLGTIPVGGGEVSWITGIDLKGEQGLRGVHGTDLEYVWEGTSLKLGRITYREDGTETLTFSDPVNLQGYRGEQGLQPAMQMGDVITLNPEETASATFVKDGITTEGADIYKLNLSIPRGMAGKEGMPRIPSAVLSLTSASTSDEIFAAWGGKDAMLAVGTSFLAGEKSNCLMSGNATLYFAYTDADNFQLDILFRLKGKDNQYEHWVVDGVASLTVTTYDNVHVNNASTMTKGKQYAFEPDTDGSASGVMKEVTVITQEEKDKINGTYSKAEIDNTFATKANTYTKDETYTKEEVEAKIPTLVDAYSKTESDERYPQKDSVYPKGDTYSKNEVDAKIPKVVDAYSKTESDERYPLKNNVYAKDKTYTKEEVDAKIPAPLDAYSKTESDERYPLKTDMSNLATKDELAQVFVMSEALQAAIENVVDGDGSQLETLISLVPAGTRKMYLPRSGTNSGSLSYAQYVYIYRPNTDGSTDTMYLSFIGLMSFMYPSTYPLYNVCVKIDCTNKTKSESSGIFSISGNTVAITGVDENSNDYTFQIAHHKNVCKQFFASASVTTLTNLPVDKYSIAATVSAASTISFASTPQDGMEYVIDIKNTSSSDITQPIPTDSNWQCDVNSVTLPAGKVASISIRYVHSIYCVRV